MIRRVRPALEVLYLVALFLFVFALTGAQLRRTEPNPTARYGDRSPPAAAMTRGR